METLRYHSTRNTDRKVDASYAIVHGIAEDGGLFVPELFPQMDLSLEKLSELSYQDLAYEVMKLFFTDFTEDELRTCIRNAYDSKFASADIAPVVFAGDTPVLELFHGKTLAFKDIALSILPHLLSVSARKQGIGEEIVILTATSGDTGKAALEGFADVPGTRIIVFYPKDGVSDIQRLQMTTQHGDNTHVVAMEGNFDDCQRAVKIAFTDTNERAKLKEAGYLYSSANSINIGRLIPQVVYYYRLYLKSVEAGRIGMGQLLDVVVPTGNFGDILAGYYAKKSGLPLGKLVCASNDNHVLTDFFRTGKYSANREFKVTTSPSMDIVISSNLERLLFHLTDASRTIEMMQSLKLIGAYDFAGSLLKLQEDFMWGYADEAKVAKAIARVYRKTGYIIDPHTAVGFAVAEDLSMNQPISWRPAVVSTASPFKFPKTILEAIGQRPESDLSSITDLSKLLNQPIPQPLKETLNSPVRHFRTCAASGAQAEIHDILGLAR